MIDTSAAFAAAIGGTSRRFRARLLENGTELGGEIRRVTVHMGSCGASVFAPGAVFSSYAEITVEGSGLTFEGKTLALELGVLLPGGSYEYIALGRFTAGRPSASVYETTFPAVGSIAAYFTDTFLPLANATTANVIAALAAQTGTDIVLRGLTAAGVIEKDMTGLTCRQALAVVAGILGGYATERNDGAVVIARYSGTVTAAADGCRMTVLPTFADRDTVVTGVRVTVPSDSVGSPAVYEFDTPNVERTDAYMTEALFPAYAANLTGLTYRAGTAKLALGDPRLEPWDVLAVTDMANRTFALPCMSLVHTFDGGLATEIRAPGLPEDTAILGTTGRELRAAQEAASAAAAAAETAQASVDGLQIGGTNLMRNTATPDVSAAERYPRLVGQTSNTYMSAGTKTTAEHGFRLTNTGAARPVIRWGAGSGSAGNGLNGLEPGQTYTASFEYTCRLFSGDVPSAAVTSLRFALYDDAAATGTQSAGASEEVAAYTAEQRGTELTGSFAWSFTVPEGVTTLSLRLQPNASAAAYFAAGDFVEIRNLKLEKGNRATAWSPAPEDNPTKTELAASGGVTVNADNIVTGTLDAGVVNVTHLNADNITAGKLGAGNIDLYGDMSVYTDSSRETVGGSIGYMAGSHGFTDGTTAQTDGMAMVKETPASTDAETGTVTPAATHYLIVTDSGVRLQENRNGNAYSAYLADGRFAVRSGTKFIAAGGFYKNANIPWFADELWVNSDPTASFSPETITDARISDYGILIFEIAWSTTYNELVDSAVVHRMPCAASQGSVVAQPSVVWYEGTHVAAVYRTFTVGDGSIEIGAGVRLTGTSVVSPANGHAIPIRIMGIAT